MLDLYPEEYLEKNRVLNICVIGAGRIANTHIQNLLFNSRYNIVWIVDIDIQRAQKLANLAMCRYTDSLDSVFNEENTIDNSIIDCVFITSKTPTHYELTIKCLNQNKHVFCEKPLAESIENIKNCFELAKKNNLKLMIGYQKRFDPDYIELCNKLKNRNPKNIKIISRDNPLPSIEFLKTSGGIVEDMISHDIDVINQIMNFQMPHKVIAFTHTHSDYFKDIDEIEEIEILMQYNRGEMVVFTGSRNGTSYGYDKRVEAFGDFGLYQLANKQNNIINKFNDQGIISSNIKYSFPDRFSEAYKNEINYFYDMITKNMEILVKEEHIILTKNICDAINYSIEINSTVYFDKFINNTIDSKSTLRIYELNTLQYQTYKDMHEIQSYSFVTEKIYHYTNRLNSAPKILDNYLFINEVLAWMDNFIDPSDPDTDLPNSVHAFQTAERIRKKYPDNECLQLCGLIHDLGKILFCFGEPPYCIVGDTYVVGCRFPNTIVYYDTMRDNPDFNNPLYNSELGIYQKNCGIRNVKISFGHDEYLYMVLKYNKSFHYFPEKYWDIIRFHSLYPWHTNGEYRHLMSEEQGDYELLKQVQDFNEFDLYSKEDTQIEFDEETKQYYLGLLKKYFPNELKW